MALEPITATNMYIETESYRISNHTCNVSLNPMFPKLSPYIFRRRNAVCEDSIKAVIKQLQEKNIIQSWDDNIKHRNSTEITKKKFLFYFTNSKIKKERKKKKKKKKKIKKLFFCLIYI